MDHLEGILFIDYLSKLKKTMIIKKLSKQKDKPIELLFNRWIKNYFPRHTDFAAILKSIHDMDTKFHMYLVNQKNQKRI